MTDTTTPIALPGLNHPTPDFTANTTPEGWTPGQDAIVPLPKTADVARQRAGEGYATTGWYFSTRKVA